VSPALLARTIRRPYTLVAGPCDSGIVQSSSAQHDDAATVDAALAFYDTYTARVDDEAGLLRDAKADLIVGDIPPLAFDVAAALGAPAIAIGNFTWDWIYETHPGFRDRAPHVLESIRLAYGRATRALELPFGAGFDVFPRVQRVPLVARRPTRGRVVTRAHFGLPSTGRVALLSFGGYGLPSLDLAAVDCLGDWTVVTTDRTRTAAATAAAIVVSEDAFTDSVRYEDLVAAVDVVITKPGYGIIAECISSDTAMLYTSRGSFREYDLLVSEMPRYLRCRFIAQDELFGGRWREPLEALLAQPAPPEMMAVDGAEVVGRMIREAMTPGFFS